MNTLTITYDDKTVRRFAIATLVWGAVAMLVGLFIALQLAFPALNLGIPYTSFGRLRPLHTNAAIFAFVGNMLFAGIYYSLQRLLKARMPSDTLSSIHFWGWQLIIVAAAITLPLGFTQGKEYAELEWPIDLAVVVIWVVFAINFFWALAVRNEKHLYVAIWFYISTIVTIAVLYIVNNLALPLGLFKSYSIYGGVQDALVQWWYGHNAVAFFLTTPVLGIMYYFLPKAAERPVYSYRLSIVHFWALVFVYIWAGPHHLLYTALPEWAQSLGMVFSLMLWAPSWGGMLNGLLTLRGAWDKVRDDPVLKFFVAGVTFYGMATFEGPLLSIKSVNGLAHYTDWIIAHVHGGALGWNGFMAAGMLYWMVPRLWGTKLYRPALANAHFWIGTLGILLYIVSMWTSGITQGLMLKATTPEGGLLYPNFTETLLAIRPLYITRAIGGLLYLTGYLMMAYNLTRTIRSGKPVDSTVEVVVEDTRSGPSWGTILTGRPVILSILGLVILVCIGVADVIPNMMVSMLAVVLVGYMVANLYFLDAESGVARAKWHRLLEGRPLIFTVFVLLAILVGGVAELIPTLVLHHQLPEGDRLTAVPYRALELQGRDIFIREGCYNCHSQMIRPMLPETARYGEPSTIAESFYDHPFQWGSKRTGPDLARVGGKYPNLWHLEHLKDPRAISPGSNMPSFAWMLDSTLDIGSTSKKLSAMHTLGVPYTPDQIAQGSVDLESQAKGIATELTSAGHPIRWDSEAVALIAYLQRLGRPTVIQPALAPVSMNLPQVAP